MVQVAAMVAQDQCLAVILLIDSRDRVHEEVLSRIVKRIADQRGTRLVTTYADAVRWARFEAIPVQYPSNDQTPWRIRDWKQSMSTPYGPRQIAQRTLAITAHDKSKRELIKFINPHVGLLAKYYRILATGTTGWLVKLLYADPDQQQEYLSEIDGLVWQQHLTKTVTSLLPTKLRVQGPDTANLPRKLDAVRQLFGIVEYPAFASKVIPLSPGREGGDAWLASEILENRCDTVLCFHDPLEPLPRIDDIGMFEQTCQMPRVLAGCIINPKPTSGWIAGLQREVTEGPGPVLVAQRLREKFGLREVVVVESDDDTDSVSLGTQLCRTCAGYLNRAVHRIRDDAGGRIAVSWGWAMRTVLEQLEDMRASGLLEDRPYGPGPLIWSTAIGRFKADDEKLTAEKAASRLGEFFHGRREQVESFASSAYVPDLSVLNEDDATLMERLPYARLVLESAAPWSDASGLYSRSGLVRDNPDLFPELNDPTVVGTVGGVFLSPVGTEVSTKLKLVGLGFDRMRQAAERGSVILVCGGTSRRIIVRSALWARLVSVLITSRRTAEWLLDQPSVAPVGSGVTGTYARVLVDVIETHEQAIDVVVPAWSLENVATIAIDQLPDPVRVVVAAGKRPLDLLAIVNLSATGVSELNLQDFELAPDLDDENDEFPAGSGAWIKS